MALTKAELLQGKTARRTVPIKALDGEVVIRPLTDGEFHDIQQKFVQAVSMKLDISPEDMETELGPDTPKLASKLNTEIDVAEFAQADYDSSLMAAAWGLSVDGEEWSMEEVAQLAPGAAEQIADEVYDLSGARPEQEVVLRHFRDDGVGTKSRQVAYDGGTPGSDTDGSHPGAADLPGRSLEDSTPDEGRHV